MIKVLKFCTDVTMTIQNKVMAWSGFNYINEKFKGMRTPKWQADHAAAKPKKASPGPVLRFSEIRIRAPEAEPVDLRKSYDSLFAYCRDVIKRDPLSGHVFLFMNRGRDRLKAGTRVSPAIT